MINTAKEQINSRLINLIDKEFTLYPEFEYHFSTGGKRLRGILSLLEAQHLKTDKEMSLKWALACELLHNATLIHDDIQDNDPIRHNQPSLWKKFGQAQAINTGDLMIIEAFSQLGDLGSLSKELMNCFSFQARKLVDGQSLEFHLTQQDAKNFWDDYVNVAHWKTGSLLQASIQGIHILNGKTASEAYEETFSWKELGLCYQICDDIRDFLGTKQSQQIQKDFEEKRINSIIAQLSINEENHELINEYLNSNESDRIKNILHINSAIHQQDILKKLYHIVNTHLEEFKNNSSCPNAKKIVLKYLSIDFKNSEAHLANTI